MLANYRAVCNHPFLFQIETRFPATVEFSSYLLVTPFHQPVTHPPGAPYQHTSYCLQQLARNGGKESSRQRIQGLRALAMSLQEFDLKQGFIYSLLVLLGAGPQQTNIQPGSCRHCAVFTTKDLHRRLACRASLSGLDPCLPSAATAAKKEKGWGNAVAERCCQLGLLA